MFKNYFKIAWRNIIRNKVFSTINILGLSLGLTVVMLITLYVKDELSYDRFHDQSSRIFRVVNDWYHPDGSRGGSDSNTGNPQGPMFQANVPGIKNYVRVKGEYLDVKQGSRIEGSEMLSADSSFFSVFSFPLLFGDAKTALKEPKSIVLSEEKAIQFFGKKNAVNETLEIKEGENFEYFTVTGITKKSPQNSSIKFDMLIPYVVDATYSGEEHWFNYFLNTFVVLEENTSKEEVEASMATFYEKETALAFNEMQEEYGDMGKTEYLLQPLRDMHLSTDYVAQNGLKDGSNPMLSYLLSGIAIFLLVIACINFVNLTISQSLKRAKEIGLRKVVGGDKKQLIYQFLGESYLVGLLAFILAIILVNIFLPTFNGLSNKALAFSYLLDAKLVVLYILIFILTSTLAGFYPALVLSSLSPVSSLYNRVKFSSKSYLQKSLVVVQFILAGFLIVLSLTVYNQFNFLVNKDLGYEDKDIVEVNFGQNLNEEKVEIFKEKLLQNVNIIEVAPKNSGGWFKTAKVNGEDELSFSYETIDEAYIPMLKLSLIEGRNFSKDFPADAATAVIVNETFVKEAGWKEPIGQVVDFWTKDNQEYTVIGVVNDYHYQSLNQEIRPQLFTRQPNGFGMVNIKIAPNSESVSLAHIEANFMNMFPGNSYSYQFKNLENIKVYEREAKWKQITFISTLLTIFISCIGLFGLALLSAERRNKEVGIRKAIGASVTSIVALLTKDFLTLTIISQIVSMPMAYWAGERFLANYPYREEMQVWVFGVAGLTAVSIAFLTVFYQAMKTALVNPVKSLKSE